MASECLLGIPSIGYGLAVGMVTAYLAARLNARQVSTGSRIRAATARLAHVRQHQKVLRCGCQRSEPLNDTVVGLG